MKHLLTILTLSLIMGCGGPKVISSELNDGMSLASYKTFDFYSSEASGDTTPGRFKENLVLIKDAIVKNMMSKGFTQSSSDPDLLINIGVVVDEKVQTRQTDFRTDAPRYMGQRNYSWKSQEIEVGRYKMGTGSIELVDPKQNKVVWKGIVEDVLPNKASKVPKAIEESVDALFQKLPL